jgi:hypothetical protein
MSDLWQSAIGGVVGFALAQVANLSAFLKDRFYRPKLTICAKNPRHLILNHDVQVELTEFVKEKIFGFEVCNRGRTVATGVQFQLLSLECQRTEKMPNFSSCQKVLCGFARMFKRVPPPPRPSRWRPARSHGGSCSMARRVPWRPRSLIPADHRASAGILPAVVRRRGCVSSEGSNV